MLASAADGPAITPPAAPQPATAPGTPTNFGVTLQPNDAVRLAWGAGNAAANSGAVCVIARNQPTQSSFVCRLDSVGFSELAQVWFAR